MQIAGKSSKTIDIHFCGNAISDFKAMLFLVGRLGGIACGTTLAFALTGSVTAAEPEVIMILAGVIVCTLDVVGCDRSEYFSV